jgi:hypothetical protein
MNVSILLIESFFEMNYAAGIYHGQNSEPLLCRLEDGVFLPLILTMVMLHGDPLLRRVNEIINRVVGAGIYNYWISMRLHLFQLRSRKIAIIIPFEEYYSFNLYHMHPVFYLLLMGWCLRYFLIYGRVVVPSRNKKKNMKLKMGVLLQYVLLCRDYKGIC